jgi:hypothetical protein
MGKKLYVIVSLMALLFSLNKFWEYGDLQLNGIDREARVIAYTPSIRKKLFSDRATHTHQVKVGFEYLKVRLDKKYEAGHTFLIKYVPRSEGRYQIAGTIAQPLQMALVLLLVSIVTLASTIKGEAFLAFLLRRLKINQKNN